MLADVAGPFIGGDMRIAVMQDAHGPGELAALMAVELLEEGHQRRGIFDGDIRGARDLLLDALPRLHARDHTGRRPRRLAFLHGRLLNRNRRRGRRRRQACREYSAQQGEYAQDPHGWLMGRPFFCAAILGFSSCNLYCVNPSRRAENSSSPTILAPAGMGWI